MIPRYHDLNFLESPENLGHSDFKSLLLSAKAVDNFEKEKIQLHTLSDYNHLIIEAEKSNYIESSEIEVLNSWRVSPSEWQPA